MGNITISLSLKLILFLFCTLILDAIQKRTCSCGVQSENFHLKCYNTTENKNHDVVPWEPEVECQLFEDHLKIISLEPDRNFQLGTDVFSQIGVEPDTKLELDLNVSNHILNAQHFSHLNGVVSLNTKRSRLKLNGCSLASINTLREVSLDCRTDFVEDFLTFGASFSVLRLKNCLDIEKQFFCIRCKNKQDMTVIHRIAGPKSKKNYLKFIRDSQETQISAMISCEKRICSDSFLCRDDPHIREITSDNQQNTVAAEDPKIQYMKHNKSESIFPKQVDIIWLWIAISLFAFLTMIVIIGAIIRKILRINHKTHPLHKDIIGPEYA